jgi:uncharacterized repeat protein (TIGR03803 family)
MFRSCAVPLMCGLALAGIAAPARAGTYKSLHDFQGGSDGADPKGNLIMVDGTLYGVTWLGGGSPNCEGPPGGCGTVYSVNPVTGAEAVVHSFGFGNDTNFPFAGVTDLRGTLFGATFQSVYSINIMTGAESVLHTFYQAWEFDGSLVKLGNELYGAAYQGGNANNGVAVLLHPKSGHGRVLHFFNGGRGGSQPEGGLIEYGGLLYGTTANGGANHFGTVFSLNPATGVENVLHSFGGRSRDGRVPQAGLLEVGGILYGTTSQGGAANYGMVFSLNPATRAEAVVYSFQGGVDGTYPEASLTKFDDRLYGTTYSGGAQNAGTVFEVQPMTGAEKVSYSFPGGGDGANPEAGMINVGGTLYGTTSGSSIESCDPGTGNCGTVFAYTP